VHHIFRVPSETQGFLGTDAGEFEQVESG